MLASRAGDLEIVQGIVALGAEIDLPTNVSSQPSTQRKPNSSPKTHPLTYIDRGVVIGSVNMHLFMVYSDTML